MGRLADYHGFLLERCKVLEEIEEKLLSLQQKYESFFHEVESVRESEFSQLRRHILDGKDALPEKLKRLLEQSREKAEADFASRRAALVARRDELSQAAEAARVRSKEAEKALHARNVELDAEEEALKLRNSKLLAEIEGYNDRIGSLGKGLGFFYNIFAMRGLQRRRKKLVEMRRDLAARIENIRRRWVELDGEAAEEEESLRREWIDKESDAAAVQTKIDALDTTRHALILRSALETVLFAIAPKLREPADGDPPCPRCAMANPKEGHFCRVCAQRLGEDRLDFQGSLVEIAELNVHHQRFSKGVAACQEIIGLVRGLLTGHRNFTKSVQGMMDSERRHSLAKLELNVPAATRRYAERFDELRALVFERSSLHPVDFAGRIEAMVQEHFTEEAIKEYFETMGQELSTQAERQW